MCFVVFKRCFVSDTISINLTSRRVSGNLNGITETIGCRLGQNYIAVIGMMAHKRA
jgi:hypothetical protein